MVARAYDDRARATCDARKDEGPGSTARGLRSTAAGGRLYAPETKRAMPTRNECSLGTQGLRADVAIRPWPRLVTAADNRRGKIDYVKSESERSRQLEPLPATPLLRCRPPRPVGREGDTASLVRELVRVRWQLRCRRVRLADLELAAIAAGTAIVQLEADERRLVEALRSADPAALRGLDAPPDAAELLRRAKGGAR